MLATDLRARSAPRSEEAWVGALRRDGYCIVPDLLPPECIEVLHDDLRDRFLRTPFCEGDFYGRSTKRFGALLKRSSHAESLVCHPRVLEIAQGILGPYCDCLQLNLTQAVELHPGAERQPPHRDQDMWGGPKGQIEYLLNVMWPLSEFTAQNGATVLWPGSHREQTNYLLPEEDAIPAVMQPGAALLFLGSTLHAGGANISARPRTGLIVSYCLGWLKPFENQWLVYPPDVACNFSPSTASLVGYRIHRPNLGNYEGQCPSVLLRGTPDEFLAAVDALPPEHEAFIAELKRMRVAAE